MKPAAALARTGAAKLPWYLTFSGLALLCLYTSRFLPDEVLVPIAASYFLAGALRINRTGLVIVLVVCVLLLVQTVLLGGRVEHPEQVLHLISLLFVFLALDDNGFDPGSLVAFCKFTTALNALLLALAWFPPITHLVMWGADSGIGWRYQSVLPEPSFVGTYSVLNFYVLARAGYRRWPYVNLLALAATMSFAGLIAFVLLGLMNLRHVWRFVVAGTAGLMLALLAVYLMIPGMFIAQVVSRGTNIASGGREMSLNLRVFAPAELMSSVVTGANALQTMVGVGVGNVEHYIYYRQAELPTYWRDDGARSSQPDSTVAFIVAAFGVVGIALFAFVARFIASHACWRPEYSVVKAFLLVICLSTGLFASAHFFVWIYLLRQERTSAKDSATGAEAAISC